MNSPAKVESFPHNGIQSDADTLFAIVDAIPALVAYIDCNMQLHYCNETFKNWFSLDSHVAGKAFPLIAGKEVFEQLQRHMGKVLVGERAHFQISVEIKDGMQYLDATLSPDFDHKKRVKGFIFHCSDVTEKNRTESALKDYFENASIGLHWVNADGKIKWANPAELKMLGYSEQEYFGHHISEFHADKQVIDEMLNRLGRKQAIKNFDADLVCKDGSIRHVTINSTVLWEGENFVHTRCFTIDVTERKRAAKAVRESEERFRMMASLVPLIIWTTDEHGACNFLSEKWVETTGTPVTEGYGQMWEHFIHPEDRGNIKQSWQKSLQLKKPFEAKFRFLDSSGGYHVSYANSTPRFDATGKFLGHIGILQDISAEEEIKLSLEKIVLDRTDDLRKKNTELKQAEKALQEKNQELEQINMQLESFANIASHDLKEPLRKIQTFSYRLYQMDGDKFSDKGRELYHRINDSTDRMTNLIEDLLAFSKSNDNEEKHELVDLNLVLKDVIDELEVKIAEKGATVENLGLPALTGVKFQFHQLFLNLVSNALKFSKPGTPSHIVIRSEIADAAAAPDKFQAPVHHIMVTDNGIGFERQFSNKIFEMFHRLHNRTQYEGTGIGLAICKKIVENHHGMIIADGQVNTGATFHIYFPRG